jgi:hypothetical protein
VPSGAAQCANVALETDPSMSTSNRWQPGRPGETRRYIYRASIRLRSGKVLIAAHYGLKAFKIPVSD